MPARRYRQIRMTYFITNFYKFTPIASPESAKHELMLLAQSLGINGLVILATEGLNGTLSCTSQECLQQAKTWLSSHHLFQPTDFKDSESQKRPFRHSLQIRIRPEIVTLQRPDLIPHVTDESYLSPEQWDQWLQGSQEFTLIDSRNNYEYTVGAFKNAINPKIDQFTEFPNAVEYQIKADKKKPLLIYCTGGIRCEKATLELKRRGYETVYQLHGGILKYLETFPNRDFKGECFVFDDRVAVDQNLQATTRYVLCPHCGDPADCKINCEMCGTAQTICATCSQQPPLSQSCSKNCAHHLQIRPWNKLSNLKRAVTTAP